MTQLQKINQILEKREGQIIEEASQAAMEIARKELALMEFEMFLSSVIPEESKIKCEESVQRLRAEKWGKALNEANGDEEKAMFILDKINL